MIWVRDDDGEPLHLPFHPLPGIIPEGATHWRCCKHHQCAAPFHEMFGRRADGMAFNPGNQVQVGTVISEIRSFEPERTAKVEL